MKDASCIHKMLMSLVCLCLGLSLFFQKSGRYNLLLVLNIHGRRAKYILALWMQVPCHFYVFKWKDKYYNTNGTMESKLHCSCYSVL